MKKGKRGTEWEGGRRGRDDCITSKYALGSGSGSAPSPCCCFSSPSFSPLSLLRASKVSLPPSLPRSRDWRTQRPPPTWLRLRQRDSLRQRQTENSECNSPLNIVVVVVEIITQVRAFHPCRSNKMMLKKQIKNRDTWWLVQTWFTHPTDSVREDGVMTVTETTPQ